MKPTASACPEEVPQFLISLLLQKVLWKPLPDPRAYGLQGYPESFLFLVRINSVVAERYELGVVLLLVARG